MKDTTKKAANAHIPRHLYDKRNELIWSLEGQQEYTPRDIQLIFNFKHLSTVTRIVARRPKGWKSPWSKRS